MGNSRRSSSARWEWFHRSLRLYISILVKEIKSVHDNLRCKYNNSKYENTHNKKLEDHPSPTKDVSRNFVQRYVRSRDYSMAFKVLKMPLAWRHFRHCKANEGAAPRLSGNFISGNFVRFRSYAHVHDNNFHVTKTNDTKAYCLVANQKREFCE